MKIVALKERVGDENRVAISPEVTKLFVKHGFSVVIEKSAGIKAGFYDKDYIESGAVISAVPLEIISDADIILKVQPSPLADSINEVALAKKGAIIVGCLSPYINKDYLLKVADKKLSACAMELMPRITKAQNMDVLSSQSNLAGYRAVIEASYHFNKSFPLMMTAAGTVVAAKVLVLGVGVAGLQAIATSKRLGAVVSAYDVRSAVKEQVESLGAKFVSASIDMNMEDKSGYAKEVSQDFQLQQEKFLASIIKDYDIVITTAQIPGKKAPLLVTESMLKSMKPCSVVLDMSIATGGNVALSKQNEIVEYCGVKILAPVNLAALIAFDSSKLYAKNLYNFVMHATAKNMNNTEKHFNFEDEITKQVTLVHNGVILNEQLKM